MYKKVEHSQHFWHLQIASKNLPKNNMHTLLIPEDQKHYVNGLIQADLLSYNLVK